jgi:hypothetical protein
MSHAKKKPASAGGAAGSSKINHQGRRSSAQASANIRSSQAIYDGRTKLGTIEGRANVFRALDLAGNLVGEFETQIEAMRALPTRRHA